MAPSLEMSLAERAAAPQLAAAPTSVPDLSSCDREPIHIPGSIQPHGFLLALNQQGVITVASESAADYLNVSVEKLFGLTLGEVLGEQRGRRLMQGCCSEPLGDSNRLLVSLDLPGPDGTQHFEVVAYQTHQGTNPCTVLEFEISREPVDVEAINSRLYNFVGAIRRLSTVEAICHTATHEIHAVTGCGRVVLYRFDQAGHGLVLSEVLSDSSFDSYLGLRFPASDIPEQARRMYENHRVRIIPNVNYQPSPLLGSDASAGELDLSPSVLRSVSPVHREYMRNMGTVCSMSVSIIIDGELWGLVSCHHHEPLYVPLRLRSACDFIMQIAASQIESLTNARRLELALHAKAVQARLLAAMAAQESYMEGLVHSPELLRELVGADGVAIVTGMQVTLAGAAPAEGQVLKLSEWVRNNRPEELLVTESLAAIYPPAAEFTALASGLIAMPVSRMHNSHVLWFRREVVETVRWAGNPQKPAQPDDSRPGPRHSFAEWQETVRGVSEPWSEQAVAAAEDFRSAVLEIVLGRAEELAELASGLQVANTELEAFSYSVSHDLRAPFRHISGFSEMLKDEEGERMSERGKHYLATIIESARFAGLLVDSLLTFSRFARAKITTAPLDMEDLIDKEWLAVLYDEAEGRSIDFSRSSMPRVMGEPQLIRQVIRNLFSNAVKYSSRQVHPRVRVESSVQGQEYVFSIADNGVGFDQQFAGKLFGVFQRLHRIEDFEGTGIGLANVRRIIGRHGGRTWAEGKVGEGATFFFTLPTMFPPEES